MNSRGAAGTSAGSALTSAQSLAVGKCYYWSINGSDQNGNVGIPAGSGTIVTDTSGVLGNQPQLRLESWDLGAGDTLAVSTGSGNVRLEHPIVSLPIRGGSLDLSASYNSHDTATPIGLGPGWRLSVQRRLTVNADGSVTFTDADGSRHTFINPTGSPTVTYTRPSTLYATLVRDTAATPDRFTLTYRDQSKDVFDEDLASTGLLKQIKDRHGNTVSLAYTAGTARISTISDPAGRTITFSWDASARLTSIVDWANVSGGIVQTSGSGNRTHRFFYDASGNLIGWADPLNTSGSCPTNASHLTCLTYTSGLLTAIARTQTYETFTSGTLGSSTRTATTTVAYTNADVTSVTDAEGAITTFSHPGAGQAKVTRPGTPASETTYTLVSATDTLGRVASVKRKLGAAQIETRTTYDTNYPIEPASIVENYVNGTIGDGAAETDDRTTTYTYLPSTLGLVFRASRSRSRAHPPPIGPPTTSTTPTTTSRRRRSPLMARRPPPSAAPATRHRAAPHRRPICCCVRRSRTTSMAPRAGRTAMSRTSPEATSTTPMVSGSARPGRTTHRAGRSSIPPPPAGRTTRTATSLPRSATTPRAPSPTRATTSPPTPRRTRGPISPRPSRTTRPATGSQQPIRGDRSRPPRHEPGGRRLCQPTGLRCPQRGGHRPAAHDTRRRRVHPGRTDLSAVPDDVR